MARQQASGDKKLQVWNSVLRASLKIPGARVDRSSFLKAQLKAHLNTEKLKTAIGQRPSLAGISRDDIDDIAKSCIGRHTVEVSAISFVTGLPGGWWITGTVPVDLAQFYYHVIVLAQKLAYLYGWPELFDSDSELDDETLLRLTLFIGAMMGAQGANRVIAEVAEKFSVEIAKRLPRQALTKYGVYTVAKQIGKWIGIQVTKASFSRVLAKVIPILGGFISATVSAAMFLPMANRLKEHLQGLEFAK